MFSHVLFLDLSFYQLAVKYGKMSEKIRLIDAEDLEKKAGRKAARTIQRHWKSILATATVEQTGVLLRNSNVRIKMKYGALDALDINTTSVGMILNYGFEDIATNGAKFSQEPLETIDALFNASERSVEKLAVELAEIRGEEIAQKIVM